MRELIVVGAGPGAADQATPAAMRAIREADCVVAAERHLPLAAGHPRVIALGNFEAAFAQMEAEGGRVAVVVSGDPGVYSLLPLLIKRFPQTPVRVLPGISSIQSLCAAASGALHRPFLWHEAAILSGHGRPLSAARLLNTVERSRLTLLFCGGERSPRWACEALMEGVAGLGDRVEAVIGERLSYGPEERLSWGRPASLRRDYDPLSLMLIHNPEPWTPPAGRPRDADFARDPKVPMTREEVRSVILDRLELGPGAVLWDVGAGTGSISAAAALACPDGEVHAFERDPAALALLARNRDQFRLHNLKIHPGEMPGLMDAEPLPKPTHVFLGGSGGNLAPLLARLAALGGRLRLLLTAVTLDTLSEAVSLLSGGEWRGLEAVQVSIAASRPLGGSLLMSARNPVTVLSAELRPQPEDPEENGGSPS